MWLQSDGRRLNSSFEEMLIGKTHLVIENPREDTAGRYTCIAENKAGRVEKDMIVDVLKPPQLPQQTIFTEVSEKETLTLQCPIEENDNNVDIKWFKQGVLIPASDRFQISIGQDKLYIMNAEPSDSAQYSCTVTNQAGEASAMIDATVNVPPKILGDVYQTVNAVANNTVEINCDYSGTPAPKITWFLDGKALHDSDNYELRKNDGQLVLHNITPSQKGRYTCRADNKVGKVEQDTYIEVSVPPKVFMSSEEMKVVAGRQATIRCEVLGEPEPSVEWLKNGEPFKSDLLQYSTRLSYLHLREADVKDSGRYTCIASNSAGEDRTSTQVQVLIPPVIADEERVLQVKEETPFTILCPAVGSPTPSIVWKKDGVEIEGATTTSLDLGIVDSKTDGRYTCVATNEAGSATADFMVDVMTRPKFSKSENEIKVIEGDRTKLECKVDGHPKPTIKWLKGGRPLNMTNMILSPRGETLMILNARRSDGGSYSCVARNAAGESEAGFNVNILTVPYIEEQIDQNPRVVAGQSLVMRCPVRGNPKPVIQWSRNNKKITYGDIYALLNDQDLVIKEPKTDDEGTYTCEASNEAGELNTNFAAEVIGKPTFTRQGDNIYEVIEDESIVIDCGVTTRPIPEINWYRGENPLYLTDNFALSHDNMQLTVKKAKLSDGGKYICRASNEAGNTDIDLILKVLIPPKIDKSNIIGNPLAIVNRNIYLECPVFGIPQPSVIWTKDGKTIDLSDSRVVFAHNNETFGIEGVTPADQGRYTCTASNSGGVVAHDFNLDVLSPPTFDVNSTKPTIKREGDTITLTCPIKMPDDVADQVMDVTWVKDSRPVDNNENNIEISDDGRRLTISAAALSNAGTYSCIALNRAGETSLEFKVEILSPPVIDTSRNDVAPQVALNQPTLMYCPVSGHPFPAVKWLKDGVLVTPDDNIRIIDKGQTIQISKTDLKHAGTWSCIAENDAGAKEHEMILDVFTPPVIQVHSENPIKAIGETITIYCNASGNPQPTLKWTKNGQPLHDSSDGVRISLKGSRLDIPHLKKTDVGDYTCLGVNEAGTSDNSISVDVLVPPEISRDGIDMSPRLPAGQSLSLQCLASGKPQPTVKWMLNGTLISEKTPGITIASDARFVQINNLTLSDKGVYTCLAENVAGNDKVMYNVDVVQAPVISNGGTKQVIEGDNAIIECLVEGYPAPQVSWLRNGIRVETGVQGVRYVAEDKNLTVFEARSADSGIYVCAATNEAGTAQQAYTLEVLITPKIVKTAPLTLSQASGSKFSIPCSVRGYPEPDIYWSLNGKQLINGTDGFLISDDGTLTVESAEGRNLKFECNAKNAAGDDTLEYNVQTINAPKISSTGDRYVNGSEGEQTSINCDMEGDTYDITWSRNGSPLLPSSNINFSDDKKTINIVSTRLTDGGEYSCTATNKAGTATQKTKLNVGVPPKILERPKTQVVNKGDQVTLWCEASGVPQPNIEWYRDDVLISNTAVAETTTTKKKAAIFSSITPEQSGVYTCKAENWVGETEEDVDLIVMIAPEVIPERMNVSTNPRQTVFLSCNATGIPEPVISWIKVPNTAIVANEKYQLLGTTLAIRNVLPDDDGFYHCIAKSEAGQKIASRKLSVNKISDKPAPIWVECDENNKPKRTEYMVDRGDSPDDNPQLLPWKDVEDESIDNSITYRCMPGPRSARTVLLHSAPQFIVTPKNHTAALGATVDLKCSAAGPPVPVISWAKNGRMIERNKTELGYSILKVQLNNISDSGNYTCFAQNSVGISTSVAYLTLDEMTRNPENDKKKKNVAVITCYDRNVAYSRGITWEFRGVPLQRNLAGIHFMNNGSLVILDTTTLKPGDLKLYTCRVRNRRRHTVAHLKSAFEELPVVKTPEKVVANSGDPVVIDCEVRGDPLTTNVLWTKNDQKLVDDDVVYVLPNNSLVLMSVEKYDEGTYKCVASNNIGKSYDDVQLIVNEDEFSQLAGDEGSGFDPPLLSNPVSPTESDEEGEFEIGTESTTSSSTTTSTTTTAAPKTTTTEKPVEGSALPETKEAEPTTIDSIVEKPITEGQFVDTPDCYDGEIDENGECIEKNGEHHKLKILAGNDNCPSGFSWNTRTGVCEDIDECAFDQPCEFECTNLEGSYKCRCPDGYDLTEDGCFDINECDEMRCDAGKACFNKLGGYECIDDPCPSNFTLVDDRYCEPNCDNCGDMPITVHMLAIPAGLPVSHIATLTAYDKHGRVLTDTTYAISETYQGLDKKLTRAGPFTIKAVNGGHAQVWTNRVLRPGTHHKVRVRAHSDQGEKELNTPKETNFLVLINVGHYPF
ncbi:unnamed protein product [Caenorhabditis angaria]|uniref:Uncharacterized protein n=1 Tax=Caenorhabditis angaria TaxID=860376 RepID=A0A9P1N8F2_9PELO|nr:unnamed protein product [Caenorhabditis angaria]